MVNFGLAMELLSYGANLAESLLAVKGYMPEIAQTSTCGQDVG
jgi:hypothetical protein